MKTMMLVSMFQNVSALLPQLEPDIEGKTVAYIPTASAVEKLGFFVKLGKRRLKKLGLIVNELDVATAPYGVICEALESCDCIYVAGGNTFFLLQELRRTGADTLLAGAVSAGKLYIGESAGAIVVAPDIGYSAEMDDAGKAPELTSYAGLDLVDFSVVPHLRNWELGKAAERIVERYSSELDLRAITDDQAIFVRGDATEIAELR